MKSVVAYLQGGLGNQFFINAAARSLALDVGARLFLREDRFVGDGYKRHFSLEGFQFSGDVLIPRTRCVRLFHYRYHSLVRSHPFASIMGTRVEREKRFVPIRFSSCGRVSLDGYWQSEKYFLHNAETILNDFQLKDDVWLGRDAMARMIREVGQSVFLHVRSYKDIPRFSDGSYALPISYYANALKYLQDKIGKGHVFVFSDDLAWAQSRLLEVAQGTGFDFTFVGSSNDASVQPQLRDFMLMRLCRHGIVADSSYSWWAGWLGERRALLDKVSVIRIRPAIDRMNADLWPDRWAAIPISPEGV